MQEYICCVTLLQALGNADFVVEAINEDEALKKGTFRLLDQVRHCSLYQGCSAPFWIFAVQGSTCSVGAAGSARLACVLLQIVKPAGILASNTSSISITRIAAVTQRSDQVVRQLSWYLEQILSVLGADTGKCMQAAASADNLCGCCRSACTSCKRLLLPG